MLTEFYDLLNIENGKRNIQNVWQLTLKENTKKFEDFS